MRTLARRSGTDAFGTRARARYACARAVPDENWVALSQSALPPVAAGRFLVHGSHDRAPRRTPSRRHRDRGRRGLRHRTQRHHRALPRSARPPDPPSPVCARARPRLRHRRARHCRRPRVLPRARVLAVDNDPVATAWRAPTCASTASAGRVRVVDASGFASRGPAGGALRPGARQHPAGPADRACAAHAPRAAAGRRRHPVRPARPQAREVRATYLSAGFRLSAPSRRDGGPP